MHIPELYYCYTTKAELHKLPQTRYTTHIKQSLALITSRVQFTFLHESRETWEGRHS